MSTLNQFETPAFIADSDFAGQPAEKKERFKQLWNDFLDVVSQRSILGNPYTGKYDSPRSFYFNPLQNDYPEPSTENTVGIPWDAFPNRLKVIFSELSTSKIEELADIGPQEFLFFNKDISEKTLRGLTNYRPTGPRGWQDEYCEWSVRRSKTEMDAQGRGKITEVMFTCENPEYWQHLWRIDPEMVLVLYRQILSIPTIELEDLALKNGTGNLVIDPSTGFPLYNPANKWNRFTETTENRGGAVHLISSPNNLSAEIYLGAAATILRQEDGKPIVDANDLLRCSKYGTDNRNSDPLIGLSVNNLVRNSNFNVTLTNPVGLYLQKPDFTRFELPDNAPAGVKIEDFFTVVRGQESSGKSFYPGNLYLNFKFSVPEGLGFTLGDIKINGKPIRWGSQIAETFKVQLAGTAKPASVQAMALPCVEPAAQRDLLPRAFSIVPTQILDQTQGISLPNNPVALELTPGERSFSLGMITTNAQSNTEIRFDKGIELVDVKFQTLSESTQLFTFQLDIPADASPGAVFLTLSNPNEEGIPYPGLIAVKMKEEMVKTDMKVPFQFAELVPTFR